MVTKIIFASALILTASPAVCKIKGHPGKEIHFGIHQQTGELTKTEIRKRVYRIIIDKLSVDSADVKDTAKFTDSLGADSLDFIEVIMEFEKEFNIAIPDAMLEKIQTVGQSIDTICEIVDKKEKKKPTGAK